MMDYLVRQGRTISYQGCVSQVFFYHTLGGTECFLYTVMAYDRFVAICHPLHYRMIMSFQRCSLLVTACWTLTTVVAMTHTFLIFRLSFCSQKVIPDFFCDLGPLMKIACSETRINELVLLFLGGCSHLNPLFAHPYVLYPHCFSHPQGPFCPRKA